MLKSSTLPGSSTLGLGQLTSERRRLSTQNSGGVNQRKMREGLGKIPELAFRARIVFFGEKTEVVSEGEQAFE